jgi:fructose PTS system EIIA component
MDNIINKRLVKLDFDAKDKLDAIETLAKSIDEEGKISDYQLYVKHVLDRENVFPTSVGFSVAIPHGKSPSVKEAAIAFGRLNNEIKWSEEESIKYVFLIAVPECEAGDTHLKILAQISRKLMRDEFRLKIEEAKNEEEIVKLMTS